jgi:hypothetical protein
MQRISLIPVLFWQPAEIYMNWPAEQHASLRVTLQKQSKTVYGISDLPISDKTSKKKYI